MTTIIGNLIVFLLSTPLGFALLLSGLIYLEYHLGKNILRDDPAMKRRLVFLKNTYANLAQAASLKLQAIRFPLNVRPLAISPKKRRAH